MDVLGRWRAYKDDAEYRKQLTPEIVRLSTELFGALPAIRELGLQGEDDGKKADNA